MIGKTISHYKILEKLGEGGMGVVYKAEDTKLKRQVALKFLPLNAASDDELRERFINEAQTASALNHPNVCTIYSVEDGDEPFIAMEFVEGKELRELIGHNSKFSIDDCLTYATQIAEGLQAAHKKGIVHRDIKPANIMVTDDGLVKVMDFGLAKMKGQPALTKTGSTLGTVAYMSPEQARNEPVDHRSDIFSFGAVLYELCSGRQPFAGDYEAATLYSVVHEEPEALPDGVPAELRQVVFKCLEKEAENRYQTSGNLVTDLRKLRQNSDLNRPAVETASGIFRKTREGKRSTLLATAVVLALAMTSYFGYQFFSDKPVDSEKSIVVLPFADLSPDRDNAYFSDGLTEEITTDLSHVRSLHVISRSSAMMFKGSKKSLSEIGKELNVQYALMGSVMKVDNDVRISVQLLDTGNDSHLWADKYRGTLDDIFDIQEQVSRSIVEALKVELLPEEEKNLAARPIDNMLAYEFYLKGREEMYKATNESLQSALELLQKGLDLAGDNVLIYAAIGHIYFQFYNSGIRHDKNDLDKAEFYVDKILKIEPRSSEAYALLGPIKYKRGSVQEAVRQLKRALVLNPSDREALLWIVYMYSDAGKTAVARPYLTKLLRIDPLLPINHWADGWVLRMEGKFELAREANKRMYELDTQNPFNRLFYGMALAYTSNYSEAYSLFHKIIQDDPGTIFSSSSSFYSYALKGDAHQAKNAVSEKLIEYAQSDEVWSLILAEGYSLIDENEKALEWLKNAVERGFINYHFLNQYDPFLENIRSEARFKELMKRVKYEWENFEV